jgi:hypothetical protein
VLNWGIWVTSVCQIWFAFKPWGLMPVLGPKVRRVLQVGQPLITCLHWCRVKVGNCLCNMLALWYSKEWLCKACWKMEEKFWEFSTAVKEMSWSTAWFPLAIGPGKPVCERIWVIKNGEVQAWMTNWACVNNWKMVELRSPFSLAVSIELMTLPHIVSLKPN